MRRIPSTGRTRIGPEPMKPVSRAWRTIALAAAATAALGCASVASATTYFTATSSPGSSFSLTYGIFPNSFDNGYYYVDFRGQCSSCITATSANGTALGTFDESFPNVGSLGILDPSLYPARTYTYNNTYAYNGVSEGFGYGFNGFSINTNTSTLFSGDFDLATVFATPGSSSAVVELQFDQPYIQSNVFNLSGVGPLYVIIQASTASPVSLSTLTDFAGQNLQTLTLPMTFDYTMTLTDTPYTPGTGTGTGGVPEPGTWLLMLLGAGATGLALRRRRHSTLQGEPCPSF